MNGQAIPEAPSIRYQPRSKRLRLRRRGWLRLSGADTGRDTASWKGRSRLTVPRHVHTREDEAYFVLAGELEVIVGDGVFSLGLGDCLMAPRDIPQELRNPCSVDNRYLLLFSPSGFDETAVPAPDDADSASETASVAFRTSARSPPITELFLADWAAEKNQRATYGKRRTEHEQ
jgi:mannose-6-phosphate isomerase-like protein (cupin superfamily)